MTKLVKWNVTCQFYILISFDTREYFRAAFNFILVFISWAFCLVLFISCSQIHFHSSSWAKNSFSFSFTKITLTTHYTQLIRPNAADIFCVLCTSVLTQKSLIKLQIITVIPKANKRKQTSNAAECYQIYKTPTCNTLLILFCETVNFTLSLRDTQGLVSTYHSRMFEWSGSADMYGTGSDFMRM